MKLSIVIPAKNEEAYLGTCLEYIMAELARSHCAVEVIVVNNASSDRTRAVAQAFPSVRVIDEARNGLPRVRQTGYEISRGDLIANVDADTLMPEGWIARVFREFRLDPKLVALSGSYVYHDLSIFTNWCVYVFYGFGKLLSFLIGVVTERKGAMLQGGNFIVRRDAMEKVGGFDLQYDFYGEDTAMGRRMSQQGKVKFTFRLSMPTSGRRLRAEGRFATAGKYALNYIWSIFFGKAYSRGSRAIR
jgi:glycosyltransferase involved in cell wall biosynthesis